MRSVDQVAMNAPETAAAFLKQRMAEVSAMLSVQKYCGALPVSLMSLTTS